MVDDLAQWMRRQLAGGDVDGEPGVAVAAPNGAYPGT
jgi:hypothetical protein